MLAKTLLCTLLLGISLSLLAQDDIQQDTFDADIPAQLNLIGTPITLRIFPNPAVNSLYIDHDYVGEATIALLNMQGQRVFYQENFVGKMLNVRPYDAGMYWLYITLGKETFMERVVIGN